MRKFIILVILMISLSSMAFAKAEVSTYTGNDQIKPIQLGANLERITGLPVGDISKSTRPNLGIRVGWSEAKFDAWLSYESSMTKRTSEQDAYTIEAVLQDTAFGLGVDYMLYRSAKFDASLGIGYSWVIPYSSIVISDTKDDAIPYGDEYYYTDQVVTLSRPEIKIRYYLEPSITLDLAIGYSFGKADNAALPRDYTGLTARIGLGITF